MSEQTTETPKHPGGRPTDYDPKYVEKVEQYIKVVMDKRESGKSAMPTIEMFAFNLRISVDAIEDWTKKYPKFGGAIKRLKELQKHILMTDGLYGGKAVNSSMGIFLLKANHEMIETQHIDHTTKGKELPQPILGGSGNVPVDNSSE